MNSRAEAMLLLLLNPATGARSDDAGSELDATARSFLADPDNCAALLRARREAGSTGQVGGTATNRVIPALVTASPVTTADWVAVLGSYEQLLAVCLALHPAAADELLAVDAEPLAVALRSRHATPPPRRASSIRPRSPRSGVRPRSPVSSSSAPRIVAATVTGVAAVLVVVLTLLFASPEHDGGNRSMAGDNRTRDDQRDNRPDNRNDNEGTRDVVDQPQPEPDPEPRGPRLIERASVETGDPVLAIALSPDGTWITVGGYHGQLRAYRLTTSGANASPALVPVSLPSDVARAHGAGITAIAFHPTGGLLATAGKDRHIRFFYVRNDAITRSSTEPLPVSAVPVSVAFSPCGRFLTTALADGRGMVIPLGGGHSASAQVNFLRDVRVSADCQHVLMSAHTGAAVMPISKLFAGHGGDADVVHLPFGCAHFLDGTSADRSVRIAGCSSSASGSRLMIISLSSSGMKETAGVDIPSHALMLAPTADGSVIAAVVDKRALVWLPPHHGQGTNDGESGTRLDCPALAAGDQTTSIALTADGRWLVVGSHSGRVQVIEVAPR